MMLSTRSTSFLAVLCHEKILFMNISNTTVAFRTRSFKVKFNGYISVVADIKVSAQRLAYTTPTIQYELHNALCTHAAILLERLHHTLMSKIATSAIHDLIDNWVQLNNILHCWGHVAI